MKRSVIAILLFIVSSCGQQRAEEANNFQIRSKDFSVQVSTIIDTQNKENNEYLDWNFLKINNQLPLVCRTVDLYNILGKPDSISSSGLNDICVSYYENNFKYAYYGNGKFEIHGDSAAINVIDFDRIYLIYKNHELNLSNLVTIGDIEKRFPLAAKNARRINVQGLGNTICIRIATSKSLTDDAWLLFFVDGKLKRLDYWMPC